LAGRRLRRVDTLQDLVASVAAGVEPPSAFGAGNDELDRIVLRGLQPDPARRYGTALEMALDIENNVVVAMPIEVARFVEGNASAELERRAKLLADIESGRAPELALSGPGDADTCAEPTARVADRGDPDGGAAPEPQRRARRPSLVLLAGAAALVGGIAVALTTEDSETPKGAGDPLAAHPAASASAPPAAASNAPAEMAAAPPASSDGEEVPLSVRPAERTAAPPISRPKTWTSRAQRPVGASCDPPYTLSEDGARKIMKRECFR
jgi:eukaryotic-like serine/threonine-protein kinase